MNFPANLLAHATVNAALAFAGGEGKTGALAAGAGAATGEAAAIIATQGFNKPVSELSEEEKQAVSALATLAAGLAGGLITDSSSGTVLSAQAGKNTAENNLLGGGTEDGQIKAAREYAENIMSCADDPGSESCRKGQALQNVMLVVLPAGLSGGVLIASTPEISAVAQVVIRTCVDNIMLCLNKAGIFAGEIITPGGIGAGGALIVGKTAQEVTIVKQVIQSEVNTGKISINQLAGTESTATNLSSKLPSGSTVISPEIDAKILTGQRVRGSNNLIGGHSPSISNENQNFAVETIRLNPDRTRVVKFTTQFPDGNLSKIKKSTLFPENWSDKSIIESINKVGNLPAIGQRSSTGETLHRGVINGVEIDVIKKGNDVTAGYPVGGKLTPGFEPIK